MGVLSVVRIAPLACDGSGFDQRLKPMSVEKLGTNARIERLDVRILRRLSRLNEKEFDAVFLGLRARRQTQPPEVAARRRSTSRRGSI